MIVCGRTLNLHQSGIFEYIGKTKYKYVGTYKHKETGKEYHKVKLCPGKKLKLNFYWEAVYDNLEEAAKAVDIKLIELGLEPVNILKRKV